MKIEIDTNKDTYADWQRIQKFVEEIYQIRIEYKNKPVIIKPDPDLVEIASIPFG